MIELPQTLTPEEQQTAIWVKIRTAVETELLSLRERNDGDLDPVATAKTRGRIATCKELLALARGPEQAELDPPAHLI